MDYRYIRFGIINISFSIVMLCSLLDIPTVDAQSVRSIDNPFELWLGPQSIEKPEISFTEPPGALNISLNVRNGHDVQLPESIHEITTCKDGNVIAASRPVFDENKLYIVGIVTVDSSSGSEYVVDELCVRITRGRLNTTVVHLRPGKYSRLPSRQFAAVYQIPVELDVSASDLEFSVIHQRVHEFAQDQCEQKTADWLGPQAKRAAIPSKLVEKILPSVAIDTKVVAGTDLALPKSDNLIVTVADHHITEVVGFVPDNSRQYLVVKVFGKNHGTIGRAIYDLDLVVVAGQLSGAVVHCRSGTLPDSISDPLVAVFEVPLDLVLPESIVSTEVVRVRVK